MRRDEVYLAGLVLRDRDVLVVGAGRVAERRVPGLIAAGARVRVVAPHATPELQRLAAAGTIGWDAREFADADLDGAWYVLALTDRPDVNARVAAGAAARRTFCVRADAAEGGTAWTPAVGRTGALSVGVVSSEGPRTAARARDAALAALAGDPDVVAPAGSVGSSGDPGDPDADAPAGWVTLVGGGPGDPGLLTVAGARALRAADVVLHDRLGPANALVSAATNAEWIDVGKIPRGEFTPQETINELLIAHARAGRRVVRLKGGDPFVFGRGGEEWQACAAAGVPVRVVPGVTSAIGGPGLAGIPVTHRGLSQGFAVVSGHVPPDDPRSSVDWAALAASGLTLVVLMGVENLPAICAALLAAGLPPATPGAVVAEAGNPGMRVVRAELAGLAEAARAAAIEAPALVVIGQVAGLDLTAG